MLKKNKDKIDWHSFSSNQSPEALQMIKENNDNIWWYHLSQNSCPEAFELLKQSPDKIYYHVLSSNPGIFERDYIKMSEMRTKIILEDLMKNTLHPIRVIRFLELEGDMDYF